MSLPACPRSCSKASCASRRDRQLRHDHRHTDHAAAAVRLAINPTCHLDAAVLDQAGTARSRELVAQLGNAQAIHAASLRAHAGPTWPICARRQGQRHRWWCPDSEGAWARPRAAADRGGRPDQVVQQAAAAGGVFTQSRRTPMPPHRRGDRQFHNPERRARGQHRARPDRVILTMTMVLFSAMALVRERRRGNMEMLIATPVSPRS